jgi:uncharacterized NAD(P)/FAD-binding protein YdhS
MTSGRSPRGEHFTVAIGGGGASGTLVASKLLARAPQARVVIVDPAERLGRGVAYATDCPRHLLNVPAGKMSAFASEPDHFVRWLAANTKAGHGSASFVPRSLYGDYLSEIAATAQSALPSRLRHVNALALDARHEQDRVRIRCSSGVEIDADALVIASGNAAPAPWPNISPEARRTKRYFDSAWDPGAIVPLVPDEPVLLLGMGLTAVDAVFGLRHNGHRGSIAMVSRRGLLPHEHRVFDAPPSAVPEAKTVSELLDAVRTMVREMNEPGANWRGVIDDVRPHTNALWKALSLEEQRRFLRHALPYWNVHRHRLAPEAAKDFADLLASGTVRVIAGRTGEITARGGSLRTPIAVRGSADMVTIDAARVINCSGPQHDFRKLQNPLLQSMLAHGYMVANPLGIGVRVAENGALVGADGIASKRLYAIGPARFGTLIETTAIPEIREQARELAETLSTAFAVSGQRLAV